MKSLVRSNTDLDCTLQKDGECGYCVWMDICNGINKLSRDVNNGQEPGKKIKIDKYTKTPSNQSNIKELKNLLGM
jgi:sulfatase maturation enzyme AslB (radical SAM superfamily)